MNVSICCAEILSPSFRRKTGKFGAVFIVRNWLNISGIADSAVYIEKLNLLKKIRTIS